MMRAWTCMVCRWQTKIYEEYQPHVRQCHREASAKQTGSSGGRGHNIRGRSSSTSSDSSDSVIVAQDRSDGRETLAPELEEIPETPLITPNILGASLLTARSSTPQSQSVHRSNLQPNAASKGSLEVPPNEEQKQQRSQIRDPPTYHSMQHTDLSCPTVRPSAVVEADEPQLVLAIDTATNSVLGGSLVVSPSRTSTAQQQGSITNTPETQTARSRNQEIQTSDMARRTSSLTSSAMRDGQQYAHQAPIDQEYARQAHARSLYTAVAHFHAFHSQLGHDHQRQRQLYQMVYARQNQHGSQLQTVHPSNQPLLMYNLANPPHITFQSPNYSGPHAQPHGPSRDVLPRMYHNAATQDNFTMQPPQMHHRDARFRLLAVGQQQQSGANQFGIHQQRPQVNNVYSAGRHFVPASFTASNTGNISGARPSTDVTSATPPYFHVPTVDMLRQQAGVMYRQTPPPHFHVPTVDMLQQQASIMYGQTTQPAPSQSLSIASRPSLAPSTTTGRLRGFGAKRRPRAARSAPAPARSRPAFVVPTATMLRRSVEISRQRAEMQQQRVVEAMFEVPQADTLRVWAEGMVSHADEGEARGRKRKIEDLEMNAQAEDEVQAESEAEATAQDQAELRSEDRIALGDAAQGVVTNSAREGDPVSVVEGPQSHVLEEHTAKKVRFAE